mmetsp:Transcript_28497/g.91970  ORF Transcript_28497/g.91970 Transcript_28497/m.91970 type:complete len:95 (-) Transcript_28497:187-471(-)
MLRAHLSEEVPAACTPCILCQKETKAAVVNRHPSLKSRARTSKQASSTSTSSASRIHIQVSSEAQRPDVELVVQFVFQLRVRRGGSGPTSWRLS